MTSTRLEAFISESNRIEGIERAPTQQEIDAHYTFIALRRVAISHLEDLAKVCAGHKGILRLAHGMDVRVGTYYPPKGGEDIAIDLDALLQQARHLTPWRLHRLYESLHPFMDGNGRTGRALWAWRMFQAGQDPFALPFLHRFYYQTLAEAQ